MNSFIGWIGGKRALRNEILQRMPADIGRYIEVFGGAGWVLFGREPSSKVMEVFNDYDAELVNIYRCIKYHPDALQHELDMLPDAREVFFDCLAQEQVRGLTDIQRAARSLYLIKASFGTDRRAVQERLRRVIIENLDFEHLIKTYDRENALFYCDPPYVETEKYYRARFQESDHKRLADALHNIKGRFLLSYNDCPQVRELYADCIIEPVSRRNTLSAQSVDGYKEVLVRNYEL
ncbi:MAG: DNA adenine methylase [Gemmiger sp.]|uniref:DNA adenine methylase n=1 Tax=Gemmiger sp. TaxID=2049027 RepID=UPI002E79F19E|nr:DNA adenine methylase [Gemmiger sp.]MEE0099321.1 DNA adenine methylase [Gemmiger sp.]